jgi:predicted phosphodiesterase
MAKPECITCVWQKATKTVVDYSKSNMDWADEIGISEASIRRHMKHAQIDKVVNLAVKELPANAKWDVSDDEFDGSSPASENPLTVDDVRKFITSKGLDPDEWDYQWKFSEWEQFSKANGLRTLNAFKVWGKRKAGSINIDTLLADIDSFEWTPTARKVEGSSADKSLIVLATDFQLGKTDWNGGTENTITQVMESFYQARLVAEANGVQEIVIIDAGDIIENFYNTSSQRQTNDMSLPKQVLAAYKLMIRGIRELAYSDCVIRYVAVPSNHSRDRSGMQSPAGDVHDDWGIIVAKLIEAATDVEVIVPEDYFDSVAFMTANTGIGVVHGHQTGSPDKIGNWWQGQSHGEMPVQHADILVTGHFHSMRVQQSGNQKWIIVGSASDRGSSWFTNNRGERSVSGMTVFTVADGKWSDLRIL